MTIWPSTLPQKPNASGYNKSLTGGFVWQAMDEGPAYARPTPGAYYTITAPYVLDKTQVATLRAFVMTDLSNGTQPFSWPDVETSATVTARLDLSHQPNPAFGDSNGTWMPVTLTLIVQP